MAYLIDRRVQGKNKSAINRDRFLRRYKGQVKDAVERAVKGRSITDIENGEKVSRISAIPALVTRTAASGKRSAPVMSAFRKAIVSRGRRAAEAVPAKARPATARLLKMISFSN
jgi:hypothetical protein